MLELEDALARILGVLPNPVGESLPLSQAHGRILTARIASPVDLPMFDNSSVDARKPAIANSSIDRPCTCRSFAARSATRTLRP